MRSRLIIYGLLITALSLFVGLAGSEIVGKSIGAVLSQWNLQGNPVAIAAAWVVAFLICLLLLFPIAVGIGHSLDKRRRRTDEKERRNRELQHLQVLAKILATTDNVWNQLRLLGDELDRERVYDEDAHRKLDESAAKTYLLIRTVMGVPAIVHTQHFAQRIWCLIRAINQHASAEIVDPLGERWESEDASLTKVRESRWGVACVRRLTEQLQDEVRAHPSYASGRLDPTSDLGR